MTLQSVLAGAAIAGMTGVVAVPLPGPDRPQKQADYAALSHPANTRTVMAKTTVTQPVPLHQDTNRYGGGAYYGGREAGAGQYIYY